MTYEKRDNSGTLGRNKNKEKDSHPSHRGSCTIGGVEYWISAWTKENRTNGEKFFSLAFEEKDDSRPQQRSSAPQSQPPSFPDDDIPF